MDIYFRFRLQSRSQTSLVVFSHFTFYFIFRFARADDDEPRGKLTSKGKLTKGKLTKGKLTKGKLTSKGKLTKGKLTKYLYIII